MYTTFQECIFLSWALQNILIIYKKDTAMYIIHTINNTHENYFWDIKIEIKAKWIHWLIKYVFSL